ncbi:MAG: branched-chain amino acid ABC transporter permease [Clostridia bacterium]|nr:branched-chain amino acid ABC transporter permease [Clostridia bacterium]MBO5206525.1 branched-chain amino acid ABC transporter permease [Clostridia bacterium]MBP3583109.1 branched-chain amino acid ABC transporter permease [Clostridia bacterium]
MNRIIEKIKSITWKYYLNYIVIGVVAAVFSALTFAGALPQSTLYLLERMTISIILAVSLGLVVGFLGELSLGHAGFMCIGAYIGGKVSVLLADALGKGVVNLLISLLVGALIAAAAGFIVGLPALRLKGDYLAIVTLAFCEIVKSLFQNTSEESFGGPLGLRTPRFDKQYLFIIGFVLVLVTLAVIQNLLRSKHGRAITAIRDNEIAAHATGINVTKYKLVAFVISAAFAGVAGVLYSFANNNVQAAVFDYNYSIEILVMVVLGGMGNITGTIISAAVITYLNTTLTVVLTGNLAVLKDLIYALVLILIVVYNNAPALKNFREKYNPRKFLKALLKLTHPESKKYADDEGAWARVPTKIEMNEILSTDIVVNESTKNPDKADKGE